MARVVIEEHPLHTSHDAKRAQWCLGFYSTRAKSAGFSVEHVTSAGDNILSGTKGSSAYVVYGRRLPEGVTEIDLVTTE